MTPNPPDNTTDRNDDGDERILEMLAETRRVLDGQNYPGNAWTDARSNARPAKRLRFLRPMLAAAAAILLAVGVYLAWPSGHDQGPADGPVAGQPQGGTGQNETPQLTDAQLQWAMPVIDPSVVSLDASDVPEQMVFSPDSDGLEAEPDWEQWLVGTNGSST